MKPEPDKKSNSCLTRRSAISFSLKYALIEELGFGRLSNAWRTWHINAALLFQQPGLLSNTAAFQIPRSTTTANRQTRDQSSTTWPRIFVRLVRIQGPLANMCSHPKSFETCYVCAGHAPRGDKKCRRCNGYGALLKACKICSEAAQKPNATNKNVAKKQELPIRGRNGGDKKSKT
ncbi:hypothetical protein HRR82_007846 [Exophiala dermatitidis]|nr:hypothetical protein HRR79_007455 [Exophiala dermatitidis]KAJ4561210.1 hypothetical protein HRR79_007436 [Exophiala dermatitidis]KAJ4569218.1 hypothetical protein HRR82_007846 [Exophiala dermatitidis]